MSEIKSQEELYDERISPLMEQIIAICKENEMPFVASFEYAPGEFCSSAWVPKEASPQMHEMWDAIERSRGPAFLALTITSRPRGST